MITWDAGFEAYDTNLTYIFDYDNDVRNTKIAIRERFEKEHEWKNTNEDGKHIPGKVRILLYDTDANILTFSGNEKAIAFASDTKNFYRCNGGTSWSLIQLDHGNLSDLGLDEHTIYLKVDGSRVLSGDLDLGSHKITNLPDCTLDNDLSRKIYVDDKRSSYSSGKVKMYFDKVSPAWHTLTTAWVTYITLNFNVPDDTARIFLQASSEEVGHDWYPAGEYEIGYMRVLIDDTQYLYGVHSKLTNNVWMGNQCSRFIDSGVIATGNRVAKLQFKSDVGHYLWDAYFTILVCGLQS